MICARKGESLSLCQHDSTGFSERNAVREVDRQKSERIKGKCEGRTVSKGRG